MMFSHTNMFSALPGAKLHTFPGATLSHMRTSLVVANSGGLSFTSFTLILTRTLVSWW